MWKLCQDDFSHKSTLEVGQPTYVKFMFCGFDAIASLASSISVLNLHKMVLRGCFWLKFWAVTVKWKKIKVCPKETLNFLKKSEFFEYYFFVQYTFLVWAFISNLSAFFVCKSPYFRNESWNWKSWSCLSLIISFYII